MDLTRKGWARAPNEARSAGSSAPVGGRPCPSRPGITTCSASATTAMAAEGARQRPARHLPCHRCSRPASSADPRQAADRWRANRVAHLDTEEERRDFAEPGSQDPRDRARTTGIPRDRELAPGKEANRPAHRHRAFCAPRRDPITSPAGPAAVIEDGHGLHVARGPGARAGSGCAASTPTAIMNLDDQWQPANP